MLSRERELTKNCFKASTFLAFRKQNISIAASQKPDLKSRQAEGYSPPAFRGCQEHDGRKRTRLMLWLRKKGFDMIVCWGTQGGVFAEYLVKRNRWLTSSHVNSLSALKHIF